MSLEVMKYEERRLNTFQNWPQNAKVSFKVGFIWGPVTLSNIIVMKWASFGDRTWLYFVEYYIGEARKNIFV